MISNSVTHLRSYTNSAIAGNSAPISPITPRDRRCRRAERRRLHIERRYRRIEWRLFHDVSQCFKCFTRVLWCFTMFNNVLWCLASRATIGVAASAAADRLRDHDNAAGPQKSAITPQKSAMAPQGSSILPRTWSHAKLCPEWRLE